MRLWREPVSDRPGRTEVHRSFRFRLPAVEIRPAPVTQLRIAAKRGQRAKQAQQRIKDAIRRWEAEP